MAGAPRAALFGVFRRSTEQVSKMLSLRGFGGNRLLLRSLQKRLLLSLLLSLKLWEVAAGAQEGKGSFGDLVRRDLADSQATTLIRRGAYASAIAKILSRSLYYFYYYLRIIMCKTILWGEFGRVQFFL